MLGFTVLVAPTTAAAAVFLLIGDLVIRGAGAGDLDCGFLFTALVVGTAVYGLLPAIETVAPTALLP